MEREWFRRIRENEEVRVWDRERQRQRGGELRRSECRWEWWSNTYLILSIQEPLDEEKESVSYEVQDKNMNIALSTAPTYLSPSLSSLLSPSFSQFLLSHSLSCHSVLLTLNMHSSLSLFFFVSLSLALTCLLQDAEHKASIPVEVPLNGHSNITEYRYHMGLHRSRGRVGGNGVR